MENNSLWREVSEEEKEKIKQESKALLNEFANKLSKIKTKESTNRKETRIREEGSGWKTDEEFKSTMISNAPFVEEEFIVAEKGSWKK